MNEWYERTKKQILWQLEFTLTKLKIYRDYNPNLWLGFYSDKELKRKLMKWLREYQYQLSRLITIKNHYEMYSIDYEGGS